MRCHLVISLSRHFEREFLVFCWVFFYRQVRIPHYRQVRIPHPIMVNVVVPCLGLMVYVGKANSNKRDECPKSSKGVFYLG